MLQGCGWVGLNGTINRVEKLRPAINRGGHSVPAKGEQGTEREGNTARGLGLLQQTSRSWGSPGASPAYPLFRKGIRDADDQNRGCPLRGASRLSTRLAPTLSPRRPSLQPCLGYMDIQRLMHATPSLMEMSDATLVYLAARLHVKFRKDRPALLSALSFVPSSRFVQESLNERA